MNGEGLSSKEDVANLAMFIDIDPLLHIDAVKSARWRRAMY